MAPTVPNEPSCSNKNNKRITRNRKYADMEDHAIASNSKADKTPSVLELFSRHMTKKKKISAENVNDTKVPDLQYEVKYNGGLNMNNKVEFDKENYNPQVNQDQTEEQLEKRIKITKDKNHDEMQSILEVKVDTSLIANRCEYCKQKIDLNLKLYQGHPNGAVEEQIALTDPKLCLFTGDESFIHESDERPQNKLTYFSVYDKNGHLCPFDTGLIEKNVMLYFSGYMKAIYEEDPSPEGGVPTKDMGPINEWYVSGFDGGELALIGFNTAFAEYILMEPSEAYAPFMTAVREKIYMSKLVIEFLLDEITPSYEDLLNKLQTSVPPKGMTKFTEDSLLRHAQFICDQVLSFDDSAEIEDALLIISPCMRSLANYGGVTLGKRTAVRRAPPNKQKVKQPAWTKATTTKLVSNMFENFFTDQLAKHDDDDKIKMGPKRQRCGICENCQQPDCGACVSCKDMIKFGGTGRSKQACVRRRCPNMAIQEADDSDLENEEDDGLENDEKIEEKPKKDFKELKKDIVWMGDDKIIEGRRTFYKSVMVGNEKIELNDYVLVEPRNSAIPLHIAKVMYMWENKIGIKQFHANWVRRGTDTILGETADPMEVFLSDDCEDVPFKSVNSKATVLHKKTPEDWSKLGNMDINDTIKDTDGKTFFYKMRYTSETARFEDPLPDPECLRKENSHRFCPACAHLRTLEQYNRPRVCERLEEKSSREVTYGIVKYKGEEYRVGSAVFLRPSAFKFKYIWTYQEIPLPKKENVDEDIYSEFYRKSSDHLRIKGSNLLTPEPFHIGYINAIYATTNNMLVSPSDIYIKVNRMYRPENTHRDSTLMEQADLNMVYWSDEVFNVRFTEVAGKCYLAYSENLSESVEEWSASGPYRFYFTESYNAKEKTFDEPPYSIINMGKPGKGKGKGKLKTKTVEETENKPVIDKPANYSTITRRLRTLDIFAGCGGLSDGLHEAGVAETLWAIEKEETAAYAFRLNYPNATVFSTDCNTLLRKVMKGDRIDENGQKYPQKGEVELLCGGPPCQGFSGMNRFNLRQYSLFKNSLVVSCLSYLDYYRPKFFVMENVRNFVTFKRSMVLKLTLCCLVRMGYQCTFGILQAGNYGVPQTRRRLIILAAAPGETLPCYPEPTNVFTRRCCRLSVVVDNRKYSSNCAWKESAPFRTISVRDAMSDLPPIKNGWNKEEMPYGNEPMSHFQRKVRGKQYQPMLRDHICKEMAPIIEARIAHIPTASGSDWRDLPNIVLQLSDNTFANKLEYTYHDKRAGESSISALRGVCSCCTGRPCDPTDKQFNTLIPWCLPHTGNRHNHWSGLYGRLEWDGFFSTTVTNPEPMGKQGRVLHPVQTRVVSVRECARSQGFRDMFRFYGTVHDKHRQVGNAVPPPLGTAIGHEIRKCIRNETLMSLGANSEFADDDIAKAAKAKVTLKTEIPVEANIRKSLTNSVPDNEASTSSVKHEIVASSSSA
ncbi:DNA (cytosine-5)-methyltransferase PliMCI [Harpegnathos saltator]|uniref:DNA (cytosine-5)-methyltransferase n=1 Tax=Harpegnathos saltator TaxID=610380 RepID=E2C6Q5_HARSA|nr:DNA (cytosine-5)-methyltransferase PliMCI [Harpegnathos saltator]EFN76367.1 DNA (cytosine-5)-methyltransferase 1 [Harpegnathos saltator]